MKKYFDLNENNANWFFHDVAQSSITCKNLSILKAWGLSDNKQIPLYICS
jgi:hypothetical protein